MLGMRKREIGDVYLCEEWIPPQLMRGRISGGKQDGRMGWFCKLVRQASRHVDEELWNVTEISNRAKCVEILSFDIIIICVR